MSKQQIVDTRTQLYEKYQKLLTTALASFDHGAGTEADGWWSLRIIDQEELWRAEFEDKVSYLGWLVLQPYAPSQGDYYQKMDVIDSWKEKWGFTQEKEIKWLLKRYKMAIGPDLIKLTDSEGVKPDIEAEIERGHETKKQFVKRIAELGRGEARKEVLGKVFKDRFFFHRDGAVFDKKRQILMANLQWEHEDEGIKGVFTLSLKLTNTKTGEVEMPEAVRVWLTGKLGIDLTEV